MKKWTEKQRSWFSLILAGMVFLSGLLAARVYDLNGGPNGNKVEVQDIYFTSSIDNSLQHGRIHIPDNATAETPAPCIIWIPGNDTDIERCSMFASEFVRRGYVVYLSDIRNQGMSEGENCRVAGDSNGAIEATEFVRSLTCVDKDYIAIGGHSLGGMNAVYAAQCYPDWYNTVYGFGIANTITKLEGIQVNAMGIADMDEGNPLTDRKNHSAFYGYGINEAEFEYDKVYGSFQDQSARMIYKATNSVHAWVYFNRGVWNAFLDFMQEAMPAPNHITGSNQVWRWRFVFTSIACIAVLFMLIPMGEILVDTPFFSTIKRPVPEFRGIKNRKLWWIFALLTVVLGPATYLSWSTTATKWLPTKIFYIRRATLTLGWALMVAGVTLVMLVVGYFVMKKEKRPTLVEYGVAYEKGENLKNILKSLLLAIIMIFTIYALIAVTFRWTLVDPRIWNFSLRVLNWTRVTRVLIYVLPFALCYVITGANLHGMLRPKQGTLSTFREILINILLLAPWYYIWLIWLGPFHYLKTHGSIPSFAGFLYTFIYGVPFMMGVVATLSTKFFHKTGRVWLGAFLNAFIVSWVLLGVISLYA